MINWRGEEDEYALEEMIETLLNQKIGWAKTAMVRASVAVKQQRDGKFILKLFTAVDNDLKAVNKRLLFLRPTLMPMCLCLLKPQFSTVFWPMPRAIFKP